MKVKNWEVDAEYGSDILGTGAYTVLPPSGKPKKILNIGFIKRKDKPIAARSSERGTRKPCTQLTK